MTLNEMREYDKDYLTPAQVATALGSDPQSIRVWARQNPIGLGFPVIRLGSRVKIPRIAFIRYMEGRQQ